MNNNSGIKRMLKYMTVYAQRLFVFFIIFMFIWTAYMLLISGADIAEGLRMIPSYYFFMCGLIGMICTMGYIPLLSNGMLSMGATRKELTIGMVYGHLLLGLEMAIVGTILNIIISKSSGKDALLFAALTIGVNMITTGFGLIVAVLIDRYGKVAYYIAVAVSAIAAGAMGGVGVVFLLDGGIAPSFSLPMNIWVMLGGIVMYIIGSVVLSFGLRHKTVDV